ELLAPAAAEVSSKDDPPSSSRTLAAGLEPPSPQQQGGSGGRPQSTASSGYSSAAPEDIGFPDGAPDAQRSQELWAPWRTSQEASGGQGLGDSWLPEEEEELRALFAAGKLLGELPEVAAPPLRGHAPWALEPWSPREDAPTVSPP
ncbi:unnamed protein product, partial [Polarella glacialis]